MRIVQFKNVPALKIYADYAIDEEANLWSFKHQKVRKLNPFKKLEYRAISLVDIYSKRKDFYIHRLMCLCFLPTNDVQQKIRHLDGNKQNNKLENLEWIVNQEPTENTQSYVHKESIQLNEELTNKILRVYSESLKRGVKLPDKNQFVSNLINNSLNEYINQYGMKKLFIS